MSRYILSSKCCQVMLVTFYFVISATSFLIAEETVPASFSYVLQSEQFAENRENAISKLTKCNRDWIILDASFAGSEKTRWKPEELQKIRSGKPGRKIVAYLSIGEAEDYRVYWKPSWKQNPPDFLMQENPDWAGNYGVKFWMKPWQQIISHEINTLNAQGFDGLYLDKVDIFEDFEYDAIRKDWIDNRVNPATNQTYRKEMVAFVKLVATQARKINKQALVIPQNGSALLEDRSYRQTVSAIGIEDLFTDGEAKQGEQEIKYINKFLSLLQKEDKPILCIEYPTEQRLRKFATRKAKQLEYKLLITNRPLTILGKNN